MSAFDPTDPHGFHAHEAHHGHHVVSGRTLVAVLGALVFFTVLTVMCSRAEIWVGNALHIAVPHWINVAGAMSIAVIKGTLVLLFFMQLRYDNPLNAIIFFFCLFTLALFLGLTSLDVGSRGMVFPWKANEVIAGGNSVGLTRQIGGVPMTGQVPIYEWAKEARPAQLGPKAFAAELAKHEAEHPHAPIVSDASHSRPRTGVTPGLFDAQAPEPHAGEAPAEEGH